MDNNSIIKIENKALFSPSEELFISANDNIQIHIKNRSELENEIIDLLTKCHYELGQTIGGAELAFLSKHLKDELILNFRWLTFEEIKLAFNKGVRKEYGEFFGLNIATFNNWIKCFQSDQKRKDALVKKMNINTNKSSEPTKEEIFQRSKKFALDAFEIYKQKGFFEDFGNPVYDFLDSIGIIPFGRERKIEIFEQAKVKVKAKNNPAFAATSYERDSFKKIMETIEQAGKEGNTLAKVEAKKIALDLFFAELIEMETELKDLINE